MVLLPGGAGEGVTWFDQALGLQHRFRCVLVDYPPTTSIDELVDGLLAVLDTEGVQRAHLVGTSLGGMLAVALSRRAPQRVRSLTLGNTGIYAEQDVPRLRTGLRAVRRTPWWLLRRVVHQRMTRLLAPSPDLLFWTALFDRVYRDPAQRHRLISQQLVLIDLAGRAHPGVRADEWDGPVLIIAAGDDPVIPPRAAQRLIDDYPGHQLHTFPTGGHLLAATRPHQYQEVLHTFLVSSG